MPPPTDQAPLAAFNVADAQAKIVVQAIASVNVASE